MFKVFDSISVASERAKDLALETGNAALELAQKAERRYYNLLDHII